MEKTTIKAATQRWIDTFNFVPGSIYEKLVDYDEDITVYSSPTLFQIAGPIVQCLYCGATYSEDHTLQELESLFENGEGIPCSQCKTNEGSEWALGGPQNDFPCGWSTLFAPKDQLDIDWCIEHADEIAKIGFFVFESDDWGVLLGIDAGGFDFYDAYWIPLYRLRGLKWHDAE